MATAHLKRPKSVKVGPYVYTITFVKEPDWSADEADAGGVTRNESHRIDIRLEPGCNEDSLRGILVHEILHVIFHVGSIGPTIRKISKSDMEEFVVASTEPVLLAVLRDNPKVLAYLLDQS